jgi:hypothetical protein
LKMVVLVLVVVVVVVVVLMVTFCVYWSLLYIMNCRRVHKEGL